ncbi:MAG: hypothetical protein Q9227_005391 [Pyrenula ochraceoflavens]
MLRRKPTAITVTQEDVNAFEEQRNKEKAADNNREYNPNDMQYATEERDRSQSASGGIDPNDELKPLPGDKARIIRTREERIGLGRR